MAAPLTLGVEEELHLVDPRTGRLARRAPQLLAELPQDSFSAELQRTTIETNTGVHTSLDDLRRDLVSLRDRLVEVAERRDLAVAATGTPPLASVEDFEITGTGRFRRMHEDYRLLVDEQLICGTQVHVGVADRDTAVAVAQRVSRDLPLLLALSASSPFLHGTDTGYASIRTIIWQRWPTAGSPGPLASAAEYDELIAGLINTGVIADAQMAYFDARPSSHVPTVELRVCDACPIADDVVLIAGLWRALVAEATDAMVAGRPLRPLAPPMHRAAMWRAARSGLDGGLLDEDGARPVPAQRAVRSLVHRLRPHLEEQGDWESVTELAEALLSRGNSADRQRAVLAETGRLTDVVQRVVDETHGYAPVIAPADPTLRRYPVRAGDEVFTASGHPRAAYREVVHAVDRLGPAGLRDRGARRDEWLRAAGMSFGVEGDQQPFPVDLVPRILPAHEWAALTAGLTQRARALELFLQDVYGRAHVVDDRVVPAEVVYRSPGWRDEARRLPPGTLRAAVMGFDLVRTDFGSWRVLEDNVRVPSGAGYALAMRELMDDVVPEMERPRGLVDAKHGVELLRRVLSAHPGSGGRAPALLSSGPTNSAWFEHQLLAERAGLLLLTADDVEVAGGVVQAHVGDEVTPVGTLYLRLDEHLVDLRRDGDRRVGAEIVAAAADGAVTLANAPGNGVADDKATYCYVPDLISYYLDERPKLDSVSTYRCRVPEELTEVLERVGELVTKPVDGHGGAGVLIGPAATAAEVARRRAEIALRPERWVAQEVVALSSHPTSVGGLLEPRHVDLRAFAYLEGTGPGDVHIAGLALTRVAPAGSLVVNSSRGGGAKDTWILAAADPVGAGA
jgi:carboxylate-amine ligase